jgi:hypothetical protein
MTADPSTENCISTRSVLFRRRIQPTAADRLLRSLALRHKPPANEIPGWQPWGDMLMEAIRAGCARKGWQATTGPWPWFEPDFRLHTEVDGVLVILFAVVPAHFGEGGFVALCRAPSDADAPAATAEKVLDVVRTVLTDELDGVDLTVVDEDAFPTNWRGYCHANQLPVR